MSFSQDYDYLFKLLLIGDQSVGKSSIFMRFVDDVYTGDFLPTIGVDFKIKTVEIDQNVVKMQIWDTAGQERFKTITSSYYKGAHGVILVYDITNKDSFQAIENWVIEVNYRNQLSNKVEKHASADIVLLLVGNKSDLNDQRQVQYEDAKKFADSKGMTFLETSAKERINIQDSFFKIGKEIKTKIIKNNPELKKTVKSTSLNKGGVDLTKKKKNSQCC